MSELQRYGLEWKSDTDFIATPMDDGCWTPWHIAHSELTAARDEVERLRECLKEARANMEDWGNYADEYFREKHDLQGDLAAIDKALSGSDQ